MQMRGWWEIDNNWLNANCQRWERTLIKLEKTITINENDKVKINYAQDGEKGSDRDTDAIIYLKAIPLSKSYMYLKSIAARISTLNVTFHPENKNNVQKKGDRTNICNCLESLAFWMHEFLFANSLKTNADFQVTTTICCLSLQFITIHNFASAMRRNVLLAVV